MNRIEFMQQLTALLSDISEGERQEALQYYNDYFDDAGFENEASVIEELESPEKVAKTIKKDLGIEDEPVIGSTVDSEPGGDINTGETCAAQNYDQQNNYQQNFAQQDYAQQNYNQQNAYQQNYNQQYAYQQNYNQQNGYQQNYNQQNGYQQNYSQPYYTQGNSAEAPRKKTTAEIVLIIVLIVFASPLLIGAFGVVIGLICAVFGMVIGFGAASFGLMLAGACVFGLSIVKMVAAPAGGIVLMGVSFILFGLGFFFILATKGMVKLMVAGIRLVVDLCKKPFENKGGCAA